MQKIAIIALDGVVPFDLSIPIEVFGRTINKNGREAYDVRVCGPKKRVRSKHFEIKIEHDLSEVLRADTVIIPGLNDFRNPIPREVLTVLRSAFMSGKRIASICSGTFILAEAGILNGLRATTHWLGAEELQKKFPLIDVDPNVLYVDNGQILTSAGASAGLDLCLHMVRKDLGARIASQTARFSVMPLERSGGQSQFIVHESPEALGSLTNVLQWMQKNYSATLTVRDIASKAKMSERTLIRRFKEQTGTSPLQWLLKYRIARGQEFLERSTHSVDLIAEKIGFNSAISFRNHFRKQVGLNPQGYRSSFSGQ